MIGTSRYLWPLLIVVAVVQSAALFKIVYDRDHLLKSGREITMTVKPVDPRDLFRGDYVTLGYDISSLNTSNVPAARFKDFERGSVAFVTVHPGAAGAWTVAGVAPAYPEKVSEGDIVLKGRVSSAWLSHDATQGTIGLRYGIETYFVPEGTGRELEAKVRDNKIDAIIAVGTDGTAALKGLVVGGERHVDPPLL
jgi:uncharacterized membrane-anchored protein